MRSSLAFLLALLGFFAGFMAFDWLSWPPTLRSVATLPVNAKANVFQRKQSAWFRLDTEARAYSFPCKLAERLCSELAKRPIERLEVRAINLGLFAGDWLIQARERETVWVAPAEAEPHYQRARRHHAFFAGGLCLAVGLGFIALFWRRGKRHG
jgi:hypothetical protein